MAPVAIIGGGISGIAAAHELGRHRIATAIFEATPRLGGRVSTVERGPVRFDDGAQFIRTDTPMAAQLLLNDLPSDLLFDITREVLPFDRRGHIGPGDPAQNALPKWGYRGGLMVLPRLLAASSRARIHLGWPVASLTRSRIGWQVSGPRGEAGNFRAVLVTLPPMAARALAILDGSLTRAHGAPGKGTHRTIISVAFEPDSPPSAPAGAYAFVNTDRQHAISWLAFESAKPGHVPAGREVVVAQMAHDWSAPRLGLPDITIAAEAVALCSAFLKSRVVPRWAHVTRWAEALPDTTVTLSLDDEDGGLFFAGDAFAGGRVHLALESGLAAATRIRRQLDAQS
ncbi:MAG: FAD-dependent oxidoreductase [Dehalococcoidia bacterium]|nr:FAD-dependent oxidoreductase [Dehalococcoidia bacterium]